MCRFASFAMEAIHDATVVFVYLLPAGNEKIARKLMRELAPGATTATHPLRPSNRSPFLP